MTNPVHAAKPEPLDLSELPWSEMNHTARQARCSTLIVEARLTLTTATDPVVRAAAQHQIARAYATLEALENAWEKKRKGAP